jgi:mRNA-degrading endonuclease RelE of RelBE toxin-antitoxin system
VKYELVYTRRAERDIEKLEPQVKNRIGKTLLRYREEPFMPIREMRCQEMRCQVYTLDR